MIWKECDVAVRKCTRFKMRRKINGINAGTNAMIVANGCTVLYADTQVCFMASACTGEGEHELTYRV